MDILIMMIIELKDKFKPFLATGQLHVPVFHFFVYSSCELFVVVGLLICVVEYEKGSAHRKYVLRKLQNKQKSGSPYECRFFALLH